LATFAQRIEIAYAFGLIPRESRDELIAIKGIRNYFAHHPKAVAFTDEALNKFFAALAFATNPKFSLKEPMSRRNAYLLTIEWYNAHFFMDRTG